MDLLTTNRSKEGLWERSFPLLVDPLQDLLFSRPQFPSLGKIRPHSEFLVFVLSAQLLWLGLPGSALFCFCCWTQYRGSPGSSSAEPSGGFLLPPHCWPLQYEPKGCAGANWQKRTPEQQDSPTREPQKGGYAFRLTHCKGCFGHGVTSGVWC